MQAALLWHTHCKHCWHYSRALFCVRLYILAPHPFHSFPSQCVLLCVLCRYKKAADWHVISQVASSHTVPVIGNGDILTHYEARDRQQQYNCHALMVGRGALIKPWIFHEYKQVGCRLALGLCAFMGGGSALLSAGAFVWSLWTKASPFHISPPLRVSSVYICSLWLAAQHLSNCGALARCISCSW